MLSDAQGRWALDQYQHGIPERASLLCFRPQSECLVSAQRPETAGNGSRETQQIMSPHSDLCRGVVCHSNFATM